MCLFKGGEIVIFFFGFGGIGSGVGVDGYEVGHGVLLGLFE